MKKLIVFILFMGALTTRAADDGELDRIAQMRDTLNKHTIEEFWDAVCANQWVMPRIPSKWHVENRVKDEEATKRLLAARDFGYQLALRLDALGEEQLVMRSRNALHQRTLLLCDLSDWFASTMGYGNIFLARECLMYAVLGLNRLTASMEFPLEKCEVLAVRMTPHWLKMPYVLQVFNDEAGTIIFINDNMTWSQLQIVWGRGCGFRKELENPKLLPKPELLETAKQLGFIPTPFPDPIFVLVQNTMENLDFFESAEMKQETHLPLPLRLYWEHRQHAWLVNLGGDTRWRDNALALVKYRSFVGFIPPPLEHNEYDGPIYNHPLQHVLQLEWKKAWNMKGEKSVELLSKLRKEHSRGIDVYIETIKTSIFNDNEEEP